MLNDPNGATGEAVSAPTRRAFLRTTASVTALAGLTVAAVSCGPTEAPAVESFAEVATAPLAAAIKAHRHATIVWLAAIDECGADEKAFYARLGAAKAAGASDDECATMRADWKAGPAYRAAAERYDETSKAEGETLGALVDLPVTSLAEARTKFAYLLSLPDADDALGILDEPIARLLRSIVGGGLV